MDNATKVHRSTSINFTISQLGKSYWAVRSQLRPKNPYKGMVEGYAGSRKRWLHLWLGKRSIYFGITRTRYRGGLWKWE